LRGECRGMGRGVEEWRRGWERVVGTMSSKVSLAMNQQVSLWTSGFLVLVIRAWVECGDELGFLGWGGGWILWERGGERKRAVRWGVVVNFYRDPIL
jgi:hypothetical protein